MDKDMEFWQRFDDKLDLMGQRMAHIEGTLAEWKTNIDRFYNKDMAQIIKAVSDNQKQIAKIEIEIATLKTKVAIWGTVGILVGSVCINILFKFFTDGKA